MYWMCKIVSEFWRYIFRYNRSPVSQIISTALEISSGSWISPSIPVKRTAAITVGNVDSAILAWMLRAYGDRVFSGMRADSFSFCEGSRFGGIYGNLTPSQIWQLLCKVLQAGKMRRVWPRRELVVAIVDWDPLEAVSLNQIRCEWYQMHYWLDR